MFDLSGRTALVTGATGGIGFAIAKALHAQGAEVVLSGSREAVLKENVAKIGDRAHALACDLGDDEAVSALVGRAEQAMGSLDILVNNAGITRDNLAVRMKDEDWEAVLKINLTAGFKLSRAALRGMMKRRHGRILAITSIVGVTGNAGQANYAASKAGIIAMAKAIAQEVASRGITVNCIAPGFIETAMTDALDDKQREQIDAQIPSQRMGTADEIAAAAVFLASDEAAYVTGQTVHVNGGLAMI